MRAIVARATTGLLLTAAPTSGCGDDPPPGSSSPQAAVTRFLEPFGPGGVAARAPRSTDETARIWKDLCGRVDPEVRGGLDFYDDDHVDPVYSCGASVGNAVLYTGDTGEMDTPSAVTGEPVAADTTGYESIVTVTLRYGSRPTSTLPPPPEKATVKVLAVRHDGGWWVATPRAFNALKARDGGLSVRELEEQYRALRRDAER